MNTNSGHQFSEGGEVSELTRLERVFEWAKQLEILSSVKTELQSLRDQLAAKDQAIDDINEARNIQNKILYDQIAALEKRVVGLSDACDIYQDKLSAKDEEIKKLKGDFEDFKKGVLRGTELYAHLRFDNEPFTPYQLALQENEKLREALKFTTSLKRNEKETN
jgi:uncharacterized protein YihD (DUF1040 family)